MVINGWTIYLHPLFLAALTEMIEAVEAARVADPDGYRNKRCTKLLAATRKMAFEVIPADPGAPQFRLGDTLGGSHKNWFRGKYVQQYRLFFRYDQRARVIVLAWVNDEDSKRSYESRTDAYRVFAKMLAAGNPPDDWNALLKAALAASEDADFASLAGASPL